MKKSIFASILSISLLSLSLVSASAQVLTDTLDTPNTPSCVQLTKGMTTGSKDSTTEGQVSDLQFFLSDKGYLRTDPTGYFGLATLAAVKAFQGDNGITQNGLVGPITRAKIASLTCSGDEPVSGNEPVSTTPSSSIGNLSVNLTYRGGDTLVPGGSSAQNVSPLSPRTWSWTTTGAASVSARYSIYGANCVLSAGTTITEENWQPWLGINITGTRFSGSNTRTLGSQYYGCTIEATYKARNTQNQTVASTVKVTFAPSATSVGTPVTPPGAVACTMDAKMCPDGSYVGRVGPSCAFAACPSQVSPETHPLYSCNGIISHVPCSTTSATSSQQNVCLPPTTTLTLGDGAENGKTEEVLKLQRVLIRLGFGISSGPTGYFGTQTQTAVRAAQARYGLPVTGVLDMTSLNRIMQYCGGVDVRPPVSGSSFSVFKMTPGAYVSNIYQEVKIQWDASVSGTLPVQIKCTGPYKPSGASQLTNVVTVALGGVSVDPSMSGMYTIKSVGTTPFGITGERSMLMAPEYAGTHNCIATAGAISAVASFTITPPATYPSSKVCARVLPSCTSSTLVGTPTSCQASYVTYNSPTEVPSGASVIHQGICATSKVCAQPPMPPCPTGVSCIQAFPPLKTFDSLSAMEEAGASFRTIGECSSIIEPSPTGLSCFNKDLYENGILKQVCPKGPNGGIACEVSLGGCAGEGYVWINGKKVKWAGNTDDSCFASSACESNHECKPSTKMCVPKTIETTENGGYYKQTWDESKQTWGPKVLSSCQSAYEVSPNDSNKCILKNGPVIDSLMVNPNEIYSGNSVTMYWQTTGATSCKLRGSSIDVDGQTTFNLIKTTGNYETIVLECKNASGMTTSKSVQVTYKDNPTKPRVTLTASATTVDPGKPVTISWNALDYVDDGTLTSTLNGDGCHFTDPASLTDWTAGIGFTSKRATSGSVSYTINTDTTFKMWCRGSVRTDRGYSDDLVVKVTPPPAISFSVDEGSISISGIWSGKSITSSLSATGKGLVSCKVTNDDLSFYNQVYPSGHSVPSGYASAGFSVRNINNYLVNYPANLTLPTGYQRLSTSDYNLGKGTTYRATCTGIGGTTTKTDSF